MGGVWLAKRRARNTRWPVTVNGGSGWSGCNVKGGEREPCGNLCRCLRAVNGAVGEAQKENSYCDYCAEEQAKELSSTKQKILSFSLLLLGVILTLRFPSFYYTFFSSISLKKKKELFFTLPRIFPLICDSKKLLMKFCQLLFLWLKFFNLAFDPSLYLYIIIISRYV